MPFLTNNYQQVLRHTRYASDSVGLFLGDKSLGHSLDSGILSLSWTPTHGEGSIPLYSPIPKDIYQPCISGSRLPPSLLVIPRAVVNNVNRQRLGSPGWLRVRGGLMRCVACEL